MYDAITNLLPYGKIRGCVKSVITACTYCLLPIQISNVINLYIRVPSNLLSEKLRWLLNIKQLMLTSCFVVGE